MTNTPKTPAPFDEARDQAIRAVINPARQRSMNEDGEKGSHIIVGWETLYVNVGALLDRIAPSPPVQEPEYFALCEVSAFHGRDEDDWYFLEWWQQGVGWAVYEAPTHSIYSDDSGPQGGKAEPPPAADPRTERIFEKWGPLLKRLAEGPDESGATREDCTVPGCRFHTQRDEPGIEAGRGDLPARIEAAVKRISNGLAPMRVPADKTDPDIVLVDCGMEIESLKVKLHAAEERARLAEKENKRLMYEAASPKVGLGARGMADALSDAMDCDYPACPGAIATQDVQRICDVFLLQEGGSVRAEVERLQGELAGLRAFMQLIAARMERADPDLWMQEITGLRARAALAPQEGAEKGTKG